VFARREVELVLLDSMMPGLSGIELLRQLRQRFSPARLPIIMVTALGESESRGGGVEPGGQRLHLQSCAFVKIDDRIFFRSTLVQ
jgi:DNA-binding response OmpR family regulator